MQPGLQDFSLDRVVNAVALWVSRVDEAAVRNTQDVDILFRRANLPVAKALDGPDAKAREAVHIVFADEKVRPNEPLGNPDVNEAEEAEHFRVLSLDALVQIKLTAFCDKDKVHLRDLIEVLETPEG